MAGELGAGLRFAAGLPGFLRRPLTLAECRAGVREGLARREERFLSVLERAVFARPASPYRPLLRAAGAELGDVVRLVREQGVEGALGRLYDAGVRVALEEFTGRRPIVRSGLELAPRQEDFHNPLLGPAWAASSSGSRGPSRRVMVDLEHLEHEARYHGLFVEAFEAHGRSLGAWRPAPPGRAGLKNVLGYAKIGRSHERWFSQTPLRLGAPASAGLVACALVAGRLAGVRIPPPEHVPLGDAVRVARWLAERRGAGSPALLNAPASSGVRVCRAAVEAGLDVSGTLFRFGGEPLTEGKARAVAEAGCRAVCHYSMGEVGRVGVACAAPAALDDVHLVLDKIAVLQRERELPGAGRVGALVLTTLHPSAPKLLLNVETDDYATLEERDCGCALGAVGLTLHAHGIRSYGKLTSEGMNFLGPELLQLLEEELPARFGGAPADYQLVEEEAETGLPSVILVVSPRVGTLDEREVAAAALSALAAGSPAREMMAGIWRAGGTLRVVRREPHATAAAKVLPLHVRR